MHKCMYVYNKGPVACAFDPASSLKTKSAPRHCRRLGANGVNNSRRVSACVECGVCVCACVRERDSAGE